MITLEPISCDFLLLTGDAWVDHPSFGGAVIAHCLGDLGFSVCVVAQPDWKQPLAQELRPRLGILVTSGNLDSMVAHYTVAKRKRSEDIDRKSVV